jgi:hypothetical protein
VTQPDLPDDPLTAPPSSTPPAIGPRLVADRTAVLFVGLVAGFAVGVSFHTAPPVTAPVATTTTTVPARTDAPATPPAAATPGAISPAAPPTASTIDPRVVTRVKASGRIRVGVFGDSIGNGMFEALYYQLPRAEGYDVLRFSKEATGFTRYHTLDLAKHAQEQLARDPVDIAVISFGANDAQDMWEYGKLHPLLGDSWRQIVGERLDRFVATARSTGATVYWIGLPVMRDAQMDATMQAMNAFYADHMRRLGVAFVDTRPLSVDAEGRYNAYLPDAKTGRPALMRTPDGIHLIGVGYRRLTAGVAERIRTFAAQARAAAGVAGPAPTSEGAAR